MASLTTRWLRRKIEVGLWLRRCSLIFPGRLDKKRIKRKPIYPPNLVLGDNIKMDEVLTLSKLALVG